MTEAARVSTSSPMPLTEAKLRRLRRQRRRNLMSTNASSPPSLPAPAAAVDDERLAMLAMIKQFLTKSSDKLEGFVEMQLEKLTTHYEFHMDNLYSKIAALKKRVFELENRDHLQKQQIHVLEMNIARQVPVVQPSLVPEGSAVSSTPPCSGLQSGVAVQVHGFTAAIELNGMKGTCGCWDKVRGRWQVYLAGGQAKWMKPENIKETAGWPAHHSANRSPAETLDHIPRHVKLHDAT